MKCYDMISNELWHPQTKKISIYNIVQARRQGGLQNFLEDVKLFIIYILNENAKLGAKFLVSDLSLKNG